MISGRFLCGGKWRLVKVKERIIIFITEELGHEPLEINLDKLEEKQQKLNMLKLSEEDIKTMRELRNLGSEEEMMKDIEIDFRKSGWRKIKTNDTC
jgi:hypothetical protein